MRTLSIAFRLFGLALLAGPTGGCFDFPLGECPPTRLPLAAGEKAPGGVDPLLALAALQPQTLALHWTQIDETTTVTITTRPTDIANAYFSGCDSPRASSFLISAQIGLDTADGRLHATATAPADSIEVDADGTLAVSRTIMAGFPASTLVGKGVVPDALLAPVADSSAVGIAIEVVAAGAGRAYGKGSLTLVGPDRIGLADLSPAR